MTPTLSCSWLYHNWIIFGRAKYFCILFCKYDSYTISNYYSILYFALSVSHYGERRTDIGMLGNKCCYWIQKFPGKPDEIKYGHCEQRRFSHFSPLMNNLWFSSWLTHPWKLPPASCLLPLSYMVWVLEFMFGCVCQRVSSLDFRSGMEKCCGLSIKYSISQPLRKCIWWQITSRKAKDDLW